MKNFKTLLLIAVIALGLNTVQAQTNVAHVDLGSIVKLMPETTAMNTELEKLSKTYEDELKATQEALQAKEQRYIAESETQTEQENEKRALELQQDKYKLQMGYQVAEQDINKKGNELMDPIITKARQAVEDVANENGFQYVLDGSSLIYAGGTDITDKVKAKLGL